MRLVALHLLILAAWLSTQASLPEGSLTATHHAHTHRLAICLRARLTVENDDRGSMYSVNDLLHVHQKTGIPIVFDFHHWKFCQGES
jgi:UV DNA damage repair endonuclease